MNMDAIMELLERREYKAIKAMLEEMHPADIASLLALLPDQAIIMVFRLIAKDRAADTFSYMETEDQHTLINALTDHELRQVMDDLYLDDAVDVIEEMPANVVQRILKSVGPETRAGVNALLRYPKDSAGSLMTTEYVSLRPDISVSDALKRIREVGVQSETIYTCYVLDKRKLLGTVSAKDLLLAQESDLIRDLMETIVQYVDTTTDQEDVARMFTKYDMLALPVLDTEGCMVGIVTVDDAIDVLQEEVTEDISRMAAVTSGEGNYFATSVWVHAKRRIPWLLLLMFSATLTGMIITRYEEAISVLPALVAFIPMLMDTSGNSGSQSASLIIRAITLEEVKFADIGRVLFKELRVALLVSCMLAAANSIRILLMYRDFMLAVVTSSTLIIAVVASKFIGGTLPLIAKRIGLDPALVAAPLITTLVDACCILVYFFIASNLLSL